VGSTPPLRRAHNRVAMPPTNLVPNCALVEVAVAASVRSMTCGFWAEYLSPPIDQAALESLAQAAHDHYRTTVLPLQSSGMFYQLLPVTYFPTPLVRMLAFRFGSSEAGSGGSVRPNSIALRLSNVTDPLTVNHPSTNVIPGLPTEAVAGNDIDVAWADNVASAWQGFIGALVLVGWQMVSVSRYLGGVERPFGVATPIVDVVPFSYFVSSRRRRGRGH